MCIFYNNGCHEYEERLEEGIILIFTSKAQGAYFEAQGVYSQAQGACFQAYKIGRKCHRIKTWTVRMKTTNSM